MPNNNPDIRSRWPRRATLVVCLQCCGFSVAMASIAFNRARHFIAKLNNFVYIFLATWLFFVHMHALFCMSLLYIQWKGISSYSYLASSFTLLLLMSCCCSCVQQTKPTTNKLYSSTCILGQNQSVCILHANWCEWLQWMHFLVKNTRRISLKKK